MPLDRPLAIPVAPRVERFDALSFSPIESYYADHPGHGLNPRRILDIFSDAESGWPARQCDLFEDCVESDGHLRSVIDSRIEAVVGKSWQVQAGGPDPQDIAAAEALDAALRRSPDNITAAFEHLLTAPAYGYAGVEVVWEFADGMYRPSWLANVPHRRFVFDTEVDGAYLTTKEEPIDGIPLEAGRWIFARRRGRQAVRSGLLRTAVWWSLFKRLSVRDWVVYAERFGLPYVTGEYAEHATPEDKAVLKTAVQSLGKDGSAVFSQAAKIAIHSHNGGGSESVHGAITSLCNAEISKIFSGATLTMESGGPGSFALGRVHQDGRFEIVMGDAERLALNFDQGLARPFVTYNSFRFGNAKPPRLKIHVVRETDPLRRIQVMSVAANELGLELDAEQVRQEFQLKPPTGEALTGSKTAPALPPAGDPQEGDEPPADDE